MNGTLEDNYGSEDTQYSDEWVSGYIRFVDNDIEIIDWNSTYAEKGGTLKSIQALKNKYHPNEIRAIDCGYPHEPQFKYWSYLTKKGIIDGFYDDNATHYTEEDLNNVEEVRKIIRETIFDIDNFKRWFKNSKVVNPDGTPMICYHQTQEKFTKFDIKRSYTYSFWFTSSKDKIDKGETGANTRPGVPIITMPVYLSIQNMAGWDEYEKYGVGQLIGLGFDGIKLGDDYVVFEPNQIKSAVKNNGNYDPNNPNITK